MPPSDDTEKRLREEIEKQIAERRAARTGKTPAAPDDADERRRRLEEEIRGQVDAKLARREDSPEAAEPAPEPAAEPAPAPGPVAAPGEVVIKKPDPGDTATHKPPVAADEPSPNDDKSAESTKPDDKADESADRKPPAGGAKLPRKKRRPPPGAPRKPAPRLPQPSAQSQLIREQKAAIDAQMRRHKMIMYALVPVITGLVGLGLFLALRHRGAAPAPAPDAPPAATIPAPAAVGLDEVRIEAAELVQAGKYLTAARLYEDFLAKPDLGPRSKVQCHAEIRALVDSYVKTGKASEEFEEAYNLFAMAPDHPEMVPSIIEDIGNFIAASPRRNFETYAAQQLIGRLREPHQADPDDTTNKTPDFAGDLPPVDEP